MGNKSVQDLFKNTKLEEIMRTPVITVREDDEFSDAEKKFISNHTINHLCVVNRENQLVGIISQKYIYKTQSPRKILGHEELDYSPDIMIDGDSFYHKDSLDSYILRSIMQKNPFTLKVDDSVADAIVNMNKRNLGCIPLIDDNKKIKGVLTNNEIVLFIAKHL